MSMSSLRTLTLLSLAFAVAIPAFAQQRQRVKPQRIQTQPIRATATPVEGDPDVPFIFIGAPNPTTQIDPPSLELSTGPSDDVIDTTPPPRISNARKVQLLQGSGQSDIQAPDLSLQTVRVSPQAPHVANKATLGLYQARYVFPEVSIALFSKPTQYLTPMAFVRVNLIKGERYLIDVSMSTVYHQKLTVKYNGGQQLFPLDKGAQHMLFVIQAQEPGFTTFSITSDNTFMIYSIEISRLD